jgi:hypothetical protein
MGYFEESHLRARRRQSAWNLLLIPAVLVCWLGLTTAVLLGATWLHGVVYPGQSLRGARGLGPILATVAPLLGCAAPGFVVSNWLVHLVGPVRRTLDREAETYPGTGYASSQSKLLKIAAVLATGGILIAGVGSLLPW